MVAQAGLAVGVPTPRKRFSVEQKQQILRAAFEPGASVARVAREHGLNANQVFKWMKLRERGLLEERPRESARLLPVRIADETPGGQSPAVRRGSIHIEISGRAVLTVEADADAQLLRAALEAPAAMIEVRGGTHVWIVAGATDLRRGFTGLSAQVQTTLEKDPLSGHIFVFRGRRGDLIKVLWWDSDGSCLLAKKLERGRFIWPLARSGSVSLTRAQLSMLLLEGIDWRRPERSWVPQTAV